MSGSAGEALRCGIEEGGDEERWRERMEEGREKRKTPYEDVVPVKADIRTISAHLSTGTLDRMFSTAFMYVLSSLSGTMSHLFKAMTHDLPSSAMRCARILSCSTMPSNASKSNTTTSARFTALNALLIMKNSAPYSTFPFLRIPAVSMMR